MDSVDYYNKYANVYFENTVNLDMIPTLDKFLAYVNPAEPYFIESISFMLDTSLFLQMIAFISEKYLFFSISVFISVSKCK